MRTSCCMTTKARLLAGDPACALYTSVVAPGAKPRVPDATPSSGHLACTTVAPRVVSHVVTVRSGDEEVSVRVRNLFCQGHTAQISAGVQNRTQQRSSSPLCQVVPSHDRTMHRVSMFCLLLKHMRSVCVRTPRSKSSTIDDHSLFTMSRDDGLCSDILTQAHTLQPFPHASFSVFAPNLVITTCHMSRMHRPRAVAGCAWGYVRCQG
jgi:hypothetical protein